MIDTTKTITGVNVDNAPVNVAGGTLTTKAITQNGTYTAQAEGYDGYDEVEVDVTPDLGTKTITQNGTYSAVSDGYEGFDEVTVNVSSGSPNLGTKTITQDGTYTAQADGYDGFSSVTVSTGGGGGGGGASFASYISVKTDGSEIFAYAFNMTSAQAQAFMTGTTTSHWEVACRMFLGCRTMVVAPSFDTSGLVDIAEIFQNCINLTTLPAYDFSKASNFAGALSGTAITSVPDWQFGCPSVYNEEWDEYEPLPATGDRLFSHCTHLTTAYFNQDTWFDTAEGMFQYCSTLDEVGDFNTTACNNMRNMFRDCSSLRVVGSLDFASCEYCDNMFYGCTSLEEIHIYGIKVDFDISASTEFTAQALEDIIYNCLEDLAMEGGSATLIMGQTNLAKLSQNAIDDANMKGWTLA